ncbi:hypothetical protein LSM04_002677 [Trypanosoma melophagium]|uniref:uncharacterized protein n=1 Tax=Trypanosoma melophagium TaxID=715481 RepID=UPI00351A6BA5|nr:hypothetical protein LSM04_002677 [Trypanosoma melophagium]
MPTYPASESWLVYLIEQGWIPLFIMGLLMLGLRIFNVHQRQEQRKLLREGLVSELAYQNALRKKHGRSD